MRKVLLASLLSDRNIFWEYRFHWLSRVDLQEEVWCKYRSEKPVVMNYTVTADMIDIHLVLTTSNSGSIADMTKLRNKGHY